MQLRGPQDVADEYHLPTLLTTGGNTVWNWLTYSAVVAYSVTHVRVKLRNVGQSSIGYRESTT